MRLNHAAFDTPHHYETASIDVHAAFKALMPATASDAGDEAAAAANHHDVMSHPGGPPVADAPAAAPSFAASQVNIILAGLARETMMRATGWEPGDMVPAWALITNALSEKVLESVDMRPIDAWKWCGGDGATLSKHETSQGAPKLMEILRRPHSLFVSWAQPAPGVNITMNGGAALSIRCDSVAEAAPPALSSVRDLVELEASTLGDYIAGLRVKAVDANSAFLNRTVRLEMPVKTMAPIPAAALAAVGMGWVHRADASLPVWTMIPDLWGWPASHLRSLDDPANRTQSPPRSDARHEDDGHDAPEPPALKTRDVPEAPTF